MSKNLAQPLMQPLKTVVVIGYVWPEPNSSAAGSRMLQLITFFKQRAQRVIFASPAQLSEHRADLKQMDIEEHSIALNCSSFDDWISQIQPDLVLFDRFMMEEQFGWRVEQCCPKSLRLLDTEDLHSLREARHLQLKKAITNNLEINNHYNNIEQLYPLMAGMDIAQREIASIYRCDLTLMISEFEMQLLQQQFNIPASLLMHLPFMLEIDTLQQTVSYAVREHFVTIGNCRHAPNWDSILWLKQSIWPKIRKLMPSAQMHVYGAYPSKKVTDLNNPAQGFYIKGWAEDAMQVLSAARICLAPLRFGAGIKGKFTDAMLCSTPSVTTSLGAESMHGDHSWPGIIENTSDEIAAGAVALYQSETLWQQAADSGAQILSHRYNKIVLHQQLDAVIAAIQPHLTQHRLNNFTGMMLRHHQHKSTKYMAQWIAAKHQNNGQD